MANHIEQIRDFWEQEVCGTREDFIGVVERLSPEYFKRIEDYRYREIPYIHDTAQFTTHQGKSLLEIGVGAGTDHLQWARAGCTCYGLDLTDAAIETTRKHLELHGFSSNLERCNAESLSYEDGAFDIVYSWGVIHHADYPQLVVDEIYRVLKPSGLFIGMMYNRHSVVGLKCYLKYGLLKGRPFNSIAKCMYYNVESIGTKAYTVGELKRMFSKFTNVNINTVVATWDTAQLGWFKGLVPHRFGLSNVIKATR